MDSFVKKVTFKDDTGKMHSYIATFVKVDGGYKISDEDMEQINEAMHKGATWEDSTSEDKVDSPESLQEKLHPGKELYSSGEKAAIIDLADGEALSDVARHSSQDKRARAIGKTIRDREAAGERTDDILREFEDDIHIQNAEDLHDKLHPGEELYTDEEKIALGNIAEAIKDRWQ